MQNGATALWQAVELGNKEIIVLLLDYGGDVDARNAVCIYSFCWF